MLKPLMMVFKGCHLFIGASHALSLAVVLAHLRPFSRPITFQARCSSLSSPEDTSLLFLL